VAFDFEDADSQTAAFANCDSLFLMRPPQLNDAFEALVARAEQAGVRHITFLSVEGAEHNPFTPPHRKEKALKRSGIGWTLLRPAYFMQNFVTTLRTELVERHRIFLPAGRARFALVDVRDLGDAGGLVLTEGERHYGTAYTPTARSRLTFQQKADPLSNRLAIPIAYCSPSLRRFYTEQRALHVAPGFIVVMMLLHFVPRFFPAPDVTAIIFDLLGRPPRELADFVHDQSPLL